MGNRYEDGEPVRCECGCHQNPAITHIAACCKPCEKCGQRFSTGLAKHRKDCSA